MSINKKLVIETPRGAIFKIKHKNGSVTAKLEWNTNFQPTRQRQFSAAQRFVDSEVLRLCEPLTPFLSGSLVKSSILGTDVGSGLVEWIAPYARRQYYLPNRKHPSNGDPLRGSFWFERMKAVWKQYIIAGARRRAGGR